MLEEDETDADDDSNDEKDVLTTLLIERHPLSHSLQLVLDQSLAVATPEVLLFQLLNEAVLVVIQQLPVDWFLAEKINNNQQKLKGFPVSVRDVRGDSHEQPRVFGKADGVRIFTETNDS